MIDHTNSLLGLSVEIQRWRDKLNEQLRTINGYGNLVNDLLARVESADGHNTKALVRMLREQHIEFKRMHGVK